MQWHYIKNDEQLGPFTESEFRQLASDGAIEGETLVWNSTMENWCAYSQIKIETATPESTEADATPADETKVTCCQCQREFGIQDTIPYEDVYVCAECKPTFFQRLQEGAPPVLGGGDGRTPNMDIMAAARAVLNGNWGKAIGICIVYWLLLMAVGGVSGLLGTVVPMGGNVIQLLLTPPLTLGISMFFIRFVRAEECELGLLFKGFQRYGTSVLTHFLRGIIIGGCTILAIIPGAILIGIYSTNHNPMLIAFGILLIMPGILIVMMVSYMLSMSFYIIAEDTTASATEALKRSRAMMKGMKWKFFCLNMRFIGWALLCIPTLGIGMIWLAPYIATSYALFYHDIKGRTWLV